jgi:hypothetical protein
VLFLVFVVGVFQQELFLIDFIQGKILVFINVRNGMKGYQIKFQLIL